MSAANDTGKTDLLSSIDDDEAEDGEDDDDMMDDGGEDEEEALINSDKPLPVPPDYVSASPSNETLQPSPVIPVSIEVPINFYYYFFFITDTNIILSRKVEVMLGFKD